MRSSMPEPFVRVNGAGQVVDEAGERPEEVSPMNAVRK
jgi:hypothetical protein